MQCKLYRMQLYFIVVHNLVAPWDVDGNKRGAH